MIHSNVDDHQYLMCHSVLSKDNLDCRAGMMAELVLE
jgi:hypothetical protein